MAHRFPCSTLTLKGSLRRGSPDRQGAGLPQRGVPAPKERRGLSSKKPRYPACVRPIRLYVTDGLGLAGGRESFELPDEGPQGQVVAAFVAVVADVAVDKTLEGLIVVPVRAGRIGGDILVPLARITGRLVRIFRNRDRGFTKVNAIFKTLNFYLCVGVEEREGPRPEPRIERLKVEATARTFVGDVSRDGRPGGKHLKVSIVALDAEPARRVLPDPSFMAGALRLHDDRLQRT